MTKLLKVHVNIHKLLELLLKGIQKCFACPAFFIRTKEGQGPGQLALTSDRGSNFWTIHLSRSPTK